MPDYKLGKIYMVYPKVDNADEGDVYYGSTTVTLARRMTHHRTVKKCSSKLLFDKYGVENCFIELVEKYPCDTKDELTKKEGEYIRANKCVNKAIPGRTKKEYYDDNSNKILEKMKQYYIENVDKRLEYRNQYYDKNSDKILEKMKQYYIENRDKIKERDKKYYVKNVDKITERKKQKSNCPHCDIEMNKSNISRHIKSGYCRNLPQSIHTTDPESN
tara:strand:+ start:27 stop:677 length:651 start_codon:yes stop_codon:yes gene_type:complete